MNAGTHWALDSQLAHDSAEIGDLALCHVRLMNDANYPWLLLVPRRPGASEMTDLAADARQVLMQEVAVAVDALKAETACHKINVAAIGNVVAQLHVHVVARFRHDAAWPKPVWGAVPPKSYDDASRAKLIAAMRRRLGL